MEAKGYQRQFHREWLVFAATTDAFRLRLCFESCWATCTDQHNAMHMFHPLFVILDCKELGEAGRIRAVIPDISGLVVIAGVVRLLSTRLYLGRLEPADRCFRTLSFVLTDSIHHNVTSQPYRGGLPLRSRNAKDIHVWPRKKV